MSRYVHLYNVVTIMDMSIKMLVIMIVSTININ